MLFGQAQIDLPSVELLRKPTLGERLQRRLKRTVDLSTGLGELTVGIANLLTGFGTAFGELGIQNVVTLVVDDRVLYADMGDTEDDLLSVIDRATEPGAVEADFSRLCLVTRLRGAEHDYVFELEVRREVLVSDAEATLSASAIPLALKMVAGEGPLAFADRLSACLDALTLPSAMQQFGVRVEAVALALADVFSAEVTHVASVGQVHMPTVSDIEALASMSFDEDLEMARRPEPRGHLEDPAPDPFRRYFVDPVGVLRDMLLVDAIVDGRWAAERLFVVDQRGSTIFKAGEIPTELPWRALRHHVTLREQAVQVDPGVQTLADQLGEPRAGRGPHPIYALRHYVGDPTSTKRTRGGSGTPGGRMGGLLGF